MKNLFDKLFKQFWLVFTLIMITGILDLIFITTFDFGIGFVVAFIYFIGYIIYWSKR